ncbi:MAG: hypothetical protein PHU85_05410 [Phycisphaerae bacterium]|nr:hypothetical protein [Phycisphaerae bacterium]
MKCWACKKEIAKSAKSCPHCDAPAEGLVGGPELEQMAAELLGKMDPAARAELEKLMANSSSAEDFVNQVMIGDCPKCGSADTEDCGNDPELEGIGVARCRSCGWLWCAMCGRELPDAETPCPCLDEEIDGLDGLADKFLQDKLLKDEDTPDPKPLRFPSLSADKKPKKPSRKKKGGL